MVKDATNMQKMAWDDDVAMIAQAWAENCDSRHDKERNVPGRFSVGQNLAYGYSSYEAAIKAWYDEVKMFSYGSNDMKLTDVGHFTQVAWATSVKLGCGFANCQGLKNFFVCNYGPAGNIAGFSEPYKKGAQGSDCPSKKDSDGLCDCGGKVCLNGGDVDLDSCTCKCNKRVSFYKPINDCELICSEAEDPYYCESQYKKEACSAYENVPGECPNMCNVCPWAGVKYAEGSVPVPLKGQAGHAAVSTTLTCVLLQLLVFLT